MKTKHCMGFTNRNLIASICYFGSRLQFCKKKQSTRFTHSEMLKLY